MVVVFGSNGFLGRRIMSHFRNRGFETLSVSHLKGSDHYCDLDDPDFDFLHKITGKVKYGIICSSITNIDRCKRERETTWRFNVTNTIELAGMMRKCGIVPVFFSSDLVFEGDRGNYLEEDIRRPVTEYGRQKKTVEDFIMNGSDEFLILRMSKLYSAADDDTSPIRNIIRSLACSRSVKGAGDQFICPTLAEDIPSVLDILISNSVRGVFHLSAVNSFTRFELAARVAEYFGFSTDLIERCSIKDFDFSEKRPLNNTLNPDKVRQQTGFQFTEIETGLALMNISHIKGLSGCLSR